MCTYVSSYAATIRTLLHYECAGSAYFEHPFNKKYTSHLVRGKGKAQLASSGAAINSPLQLRRTESKLTRSCAGVRLKEKNGRWAGGEVVKSKASLAIEENEKRNERDKR